jgi:hypothetical protein
MTDHVTDAAVLQQIRLNPANLTPIVRAGDRAVKQEMQRFSGLAVVEYAHDERFGRNLEPVELLDLSRSRLRLLRTSELSEPLGRQTPALCESCDQQSENSIPKETDLAGNRAPTRSPAYHLRGR